MIKIIITLHTKSVNSFTLVHTVPKDFSVEDWVNTRINSLRLLEVTSVTWDLLQ